MKKSSKVNEGIKSHYKKKKNSVECSISYAVRLKKKTSFILGQSLSFSLEKSMWFKKKNKDKIFIWCLSKYDLHTNELLI